MRSRSVEDLESCRSLLPEGTIGFVPSELMTEDNILLRDGNDYAFFEKKSDGVYNGHYLLRSRGRAAYLVCRKFLDEMFSKDCKVITGLTPISLKGALWMTKRLGFQDCGTVDTAAGTMTLSILIKEDYQ